MSSIAADSVGPTVTSRYFNYLSIYNVSPCIFMYILTPCDLCGTDVFVRLMTDALSVNIVRGFGRILADVWILTVIRAWSERVTSRWSRASALRGQVIFQPSTDMFSCFHDWSTGFQRRYTSWEKASHDVRDKTRQASRRKPLTRRSIIALLQPGLSKRRCQGQL